MHVYMIICDADVSSVTGTGKYYVGKTVTTDLNKYLKEQLRQANKGSDEKTFLYRAMRKHNNPADWRIHSLMSTLPSDPEIKEWEKELVEMFRCRDHKVGYNICAGGDCPPSPKGRKLSEATKQKHREIALASGFGTIVRPPNAALGRPGVPHSIEHTQKVALANTGKHRTLSAETRKRMSIAHLGNKNVLGKRWHRKETI
jgi:hypothetical protein